MNHISVRLEEERGFDWDDDDCLSGFTKDEIMAELIRLVEEKIEEEFTAYTHDVAWHPDQQGGHAKDEVEVAGDKNSITSTIEEELNEFLNSLTFMDAITSLQNVQDFGRKTSITNRKDE